MTQFTLADMEPRTPPPVRPERPAQKTASPPQPDMSTPAASGLEYCTTCGAVGPVEFDICADEPNIDACAACIRHRHEQHGLRGGGFERNGDTIRFYSQTTGIETCALRHVVRVHLGIMANNVFPYSINLIDDAGRWHCYGVTKECGELVISTLGLTFRKDDVNGIDEWNPASPPEHASRSTNIVEGEHHGS